MCMCKYIYVCMCSQNKLFRVVLSLQWHFTLENEGPTCKILHRQTRDIVFKAFNYFKREDEDCGSAHGSCAICGVRQVE
jgi:hypothetical protein